MSSGDISSRPHGRFAWNTYESVHRPIVPTAQAAPNTILNAPETLIIIGAGLAGCWLARTLAERGVAVSLIDQNNQVAGGASGNPVGIVKPYVTRTPSFAMQFHVQAHQYLLHQLAQWQLTTPAEFHEIGVLQLVENAFPTSDTYISLCARSADEQAGVSLASRALAFNHSGWLNPGALCQALIQHPLISLQLDTQITHCSPDTELNSPNAWRLFMNDGSERLAHHLVIACGEALNLVPDSSTLPIIPARGQLSCFAFTPHSPAPKCVISGRHYVIPSGNKLWVGATFERNDTSVAVTDEGHKQNLAGLNALLPSLQVEPDAIGGRSGIRATTPDRLPIVGPVPDFPRAAIAYTELKHGRPNAHYPGLPTHKGLYVLSGLGSRGIVTAPFSACLLADYLMHQTSTDGFDIRPENLQTGTKSQSSPDNGGLNIDTLYGWSALVNPARFFIRQLKRGIKYTA